jgi:hypothetical protein
MTLAEPVQITTLIAAIFEKLKITYYIVGSLASSLYGIPRATADVDVMADIESNHIQSFVSSLKDDFYFDVERIRKSVRDRSSFNILHLETMFKVDIFLTQRDEISLEEMSRREKFRIGEKKEQSLYLASAEDIILNKLIWYKSGGCVSDRQWQDVLGIFRVLGQKLDIEYLRNRAEKRAILDLLEKALEEASVTACR